LVTPTAADGAQRRAEAVDRRQPVGQTVEIGEDQELLFAGQRIEIGGQEVRAEAEVGAGLVERRDDRVDADRGLRRDRAGMRQRSGRDVRRRVRCRRRAGSDAEEQDRRDQNRAPQRGATALAGAASVVWVVIGLLANHQWW